MEGPAYLSHISVGCSRQGTEPHAKGGRSWRRILRPTWGSMTASGSSWWRSCALGSESPSSARCPKEPHLIQRLFRRLTREGTVAACYEAGVSGYDLYRQITACGVACQVIAPALTPRRPGQRIKTDRRDAAKLVRLFRAGELTAIHVPDEAEEAVRDLTRCREDVRRDVLRWRHRVLKFLDRHGRLYVTGKNWTQRHWTWIRAQRFALAPLQRTFDATLFALEQAPHPPGRTGQGDRGPGGARALCASPSAGSAASAGSTPCRP